MSIPRRIAILGSTGSIGTQTLDVVRAFPDRFEIVALAAGRVTPQFRDQVAEFAPRLVASRDEPGWSADDGHSASLEEIATADDVDLVVMATPGGAGIGPTVAALDAGKPVALANKEALVAAGEIATAAAQRSGAPILPIDSEHSALWQCLHEQAACVPPSATPMGIERLILTASGGAFRDRPAETLASLKAEDALNHPTWAMGPKVTIDSASLLNKGFELIEAHWLFGLPYDRLAVLIHRESIVHSLVEFVDGALKAQLGAPDMRTPIQYALTFPERLANERLPRLDLGAIGQLRFENPEVGRYPLLDLALAAGRAGDAYPAVLGGADEAAVDLFLRDEIRFGDLAPLVGLALDAFTGSGELTLEAVLDADRWARQYVYQQVRVAV
ncbi:MAG: 1-deoxy-D-xylulose-5-phosphate reductoisomerase [Dehalococcoidia bacterium]